MAENITSRLKAISFDREIKNLTKGFVGREWLFQEIDRWLTERDERFFILTGEPGVGKSAISAQLLNTRKSQIAAYHFCLANNSGTIQPSRVLLSIAAQLPEFFPD